ncbi:MAG TPA: DUF393 domain-containing protein [Phycisphaerae bacterium]|nr:DUF393 domain-containing protein [Phycisphaerae bacterium]
MGDGERLSSVEGVRGWVLYDGGCGICARWVPFWAGTLRRARLRTAALQEGWVRKRLQGSAEEMLRDIRILFEDGRQLSGADVYRYVMRHTWWAFPVYVLSIVPGARHIFDAAYRGFANRRLRISAACGIVPPKGSEGKR